MDSALIIKFVAVALVLLAAVVGAYLPRRFGLTEQGRRNLVLGSAFAGGVFLGGGLIHLLPDADELLSKQGFGGDYPMAAFIAASGFVMVLLMEHVIGSETQDEGEHHSSAAILLLVLGLHSVIAGIALGLEQDAAATVAILIAVVGHKSSAAFALGATLQQAGVTGTAYVHRIAMFAASTPLGIVIGSVVGEALEGGAAQLTEGIFDGVAAGTFLYIATMEITAEVFSDRERRVAKGAFATAGLGVMALVGIWT